VIDPLVEGLGRFERAADRAPQLAQLGLEGLRRGQVGGAQGREIERRDLELLRPGGEIVALVKPQFEVGKGQVGKGGVVRDPELRARVLSELDRFFRGLGLTCSQAVPSPIEGPKGNQEFFILLHF